MNLEAIIFDLGNVIVHYDAERAHGLFEVSEPLPFGDEWAELQAHSRGQITTTEFVQHLNQRLKRALSVAEFDEAWHPFFELNESIAQLVPQLRTKYQLALLSNTIASHWQCCQRKFSETFLHFDPILLSYELGLLKPEHTIFRTATTRLGLPPERCLFVDDTAANVEAARAAGLKAVQYAGAETDSFLRSLL